jgi:hypothetical protein
VEKDYSNIVIQCTEQRIWYLPGMLIAFMPRVSISNI